MENPIITPGRTMLLFIFGGAIIEFVNYVRKEHRYKDVLSFIVNYPGYTIMGAGAVGGLGLFVGRPIVGLIQNHGSN